MHEYRYAHCQTYPWDTKKRENISEKTEQKIGSKLTVCETLRAKRRDIPDFTDKNSNHSGNPG